MAAKRAEFVTWAVPQADNVKSIPFLWGNMDVDLWMHHLKVCIHIVPDTSSVLLQELFLYFFYRSLKVHSEPNLSSDQ